MTPRGQAENAPTSTGYAVEGRGKPGIAGGCGSVQRAPPCLKEAGSEDFSRSDGEGLLLGQVWMANVQKPFDVSSGSQSIDY